jgi:hypothetical protein
MIGKGAGRFARTLAGKVRKRKGKHAADLGVPSDTVKREAVAGERSPRAHTPSPKRETGLLAGGESARQRRGWASKKKTIDRLDNELTTKESRITALRKKVEETKEGKVKYKLAGQINTLKDRIKTIKERMELEVAGMKGMVERKGPAVQVKTGGTVKRFKGGLIGMGAALRGGGAVRKRS